MRWTAHGGINYVISIIWDLHLANGEQRLHNVICLFAYLIQFVLRNRTRNCRRRMRWARVHRVPTTDAYLCQSPVSDWLCVRSPFAVHHLIAAVRAFCGQLQRIPHIELYQINCGELCVAFMVSDGGTNGRGIELIECLVEFRWTLRKLRSHKINLKNWKWELSKCSCSKWCSCDWRFFAWNVNTNRHFWCSICHY